MPEIIVLSGVTAAMAVGGVAEWLWRNHHRRHHPR